MATKNLAIAASLILLLVAAVWLGILQVSQQRADANATEATATAPPVVYAPGPTVPVTKAAGDGRRSYENGAYRFALAYPEELAVHEYQEADGAMSATFKDETTGKAFQVYVTPYAEAEVTEERFALDQPSGVRENTRDFLIGGVRGIRLDGNNAAMGDTTEVWVINNGYLYEIVTYRQFSDWLDTILQTWTFI